MVCGCLKECYPTLLTTGVVGNTGSVVSSAIRNIFKVYSVGELVQLISFLQNEKKNWKTETYVVAVLSTVFWLWMNEWGLIPGRDRDLFLRHSFQTGFEAYSMDTEGIFPGCRAAETDNSLSI